MKKTNSFKKLVTLIKNILASSAILFMIICLSSCSPANTPTYLPSRQPAGGASIPPTIANPNNVQTEVKNIPSTVPNAQAGRQPAGGASIPPTIANPNNVQTEVKNIPSTVLNAQAGSNEGMPKTGIFSISQANTTKPSEVLQEISTGFGGNGPICSSDYKVPTLDHFSKNMLLGDIWLVSCGWRPNEKVVFNLYFPDGRLLTENFIAQADGMSYLVDYHLITSVLDNVGNYSFEFQGSSGKITNSFSTIKPIKAGIYRQKNEKWVLEEFNNINNADKWFLYNFAPDERVRIYAYKNKLFVGWQEFQVDNKGQLIIAFSNSSDYVFGLIGDNSGEFGRYKIKQPHFLNFMSCNQTCTGANTSRTFAEKSTSIYFQWSYENIPVGSHYVRKWTQDGKSWAVYDCAWSGPEAGVDKVTMTEPGGIKSGNWQVSIEINDQVVLSENFQVQGKWDYWDPAGNFNTCYGKK